MEAYLKVLTDSPPLFSPDFVVTVPQVLHALCLTHDGASRVQEANVFPAVSSPTLPSSAPLVGSANGTFYTLLPENSLLAQAANPFLISLHPASYFVYLYSALVI